MVLQESVTKIRWRDSLHRWESAISHDSRRPQTKTAGTHQWEKSVVRLRQRGIKLQRKKSRRQKVRAAFVPSSSQTFVCPKCGRGCSSRFGLYSHQQACKNWPSTFPTILLCKERAIIHHYILTTYTHHLSLELKKLYRPVNRVSNDEDDPSLGIQVMNVAGNSHPGFSALFIARHQWPLTIVKEIWWRPIP